MNEELERVETRVRKRENSRSWLMGASAAVGASVSLLFQWLKQ